MSGRRSGLVVSILIVVAGFSCALSVVTQNAAAATLFVGGTGPGNYTTIQDAINASFPGDTVIVYSGTYHERLIIARPVTLIGEGPESSTIQGDGLSSTVYVEADWVNITGFTLNGGVSPQVGSAIYLYNVRNCSISNINVSGSYGGLWLVQSSDSVVANSNLSFNFNNGIILESSHNNTIQGNVIESNRGSGIVFGQSANNLIADNNISNNKHAGVELAGSSSRNNRIFSNSLISNGWAGISVEYSEGQQVFNNTMVGSGVFLDGGGELNHWVSHDIDASNTVNGKPVRFLKNLTGGAVPPGAGQAILANCTNVIVENQNMSNASIGVTLGLSSWNVIRNNVVSGNVYGFHLRTSHNNTIERNTAMDDNTGIRLGGWNNDNIIVNNNFSHNSYSGLSATFFDQNNTIDGNTLSSNRMSGIELQMSKGSIVTNNTVFSNEWYGINIYSGSNETVRNNIASGNNHSGIEVGWSRDCDVQNNTAFSNTNRGIFVSCDNSVVSNNTAYDNEDGIHVSVRDWNLISNNTIRSNRMHGLYLIYSNNNTIVGNSIADNEFGAYLNSSFDNMIHHNHFVDNTNQSVDLGINLWDNGYPSGGNYWSDYTGPDEFSGPDQTNPRCDNIGDTPYYIHGGQNVDRYPLNLSACSPWIPNTRPSVDITEPENGSTLSGEFTVTGTASDPEGTLERVEIKIDDGPWTNATGTASWSFEWDTESATNGLHTIHARSYDGENFSNVVNVTVTVDNYGPPPAGTDDAIWIAVIVAVVTLLVLFSIGIFLYWRRRTEPEAVETGEEEPPLD